MLDQLLPLACIGVALATVPNIRWRWVIPLGLVGMALGFYVPVDFSDGLFLAGGFIAMGGLLICSNSWLERFIAPGSLLFGYLAGHALISLATQSRFSALQVALFALPVIIAVLGRIFYQRWFVIAAHRRQLDAGGGCHDVRLVSQASGSRADRRA